MATFWLDFTKEKLTSIVPPESGKDTYRDERNKRLALRVTPSGAKSFYHVRKVGGRVEWMYLDRFPDLAVSVARTRCDQVNGQYVKGNNPAEERRQERASQQSEPTLGKLWELYKAAYESGATRGGGRSVKTLESQWRVWLQRWESKRLTAITDSMVERLRDEIRQKRSTTLANKIIVHGRAMYAFAARSRQIKYTGINPFALVDKFPEKRSRKQRLKQSDIAKFFAALDTVTPAMRDFFLCCLFIGARAGNVKAMRWQDLDLDGGVWTIPMTKSGDPHEVSLAEPVIELLRACKTSDSDTWVFPAVSKSGHLETYRKAWLHVCDAAGIKNLRVHDLRRTLSSWAQEAKVSIALVQAQLGHLDPKTTLRHYTTIAGSARRTAVDETVKAMLDAAQGTRH